MRQPVLATVALLFAALTTACGTAAVASAAAIQVNRPCFADQDDRADTVQLSGTGFTPDAPYRVLLDGRPLSGGAGRTDGAGNVAGSFAAPDVPTPARQHTFRLALQEGASAPETTFTVARLTASFFPATGPPSSLLIRFSVSGFGLQGDAGPPVYLHYVRPGGRLERTIRLGMATGPCGALRTARRRLFGFAARRGSWRLQFDTRRAYARGTRTAEFLSVTVGVTVR